jgi:hypothetical protein
MHPHALLLLLLLLRLPAGLVSRVPTAHSILLSAVVGPLGLLCHQLTKVSNCFSLALLNPIYIAARCASAVAGVHYCKALHMLLFTIAISCRLMLLLLLLLFFCLTASGHILFGGQHHWQGPAYAAVHDCNELSTAAAAAAAAAVFLSHCVRPHTLCWLVSPARTCGLLPSLWQRKAARARSPSCHMSDCHSLTEGWFSYNMLVVVLRGNLDDDGMGLAFGNPAR